MIDSELAALKVSHEELKGRFDRHEDLIMKKLGGIFDRMDGISQSINGRPTWTVLTFISILTTLAGILLTIILKGHP